MLWLQTVRENPQSHHIKPSQLRENLWGLETKKSEHTFICQVLIFIISRKCQKIVFRIPLDTIHRCSIRYLMYSSSSLNADNINKKILAGGSYEYRHQNKILSSTRINTKVDNQKYTQVDDLYTLLLVDVQSVSFGIQSLTRDGNRFSIFTRDLPAHRRTRFPISLSMITC